MARRKVNNFSTDKEVYKSQVACVSYLNLNQNTALKEKFYKCLSTQFDSKTSAHIRKRLKTTVHVPFLFSCSTRTGSH